MPANQPRISAILVAAGESRRMGQLKPLLPFGESTVIETCLATLLAAELFEIVVVLGHRAAEIRSVIEPNLTSQIKLVLNPDYLNGMSSSIQAGVRAADSEATSYLIALVDQPLITSELILKLLAAQRTSGRRMVIPQYRGKGGHPVLFASSLRAAILAINPQVGLRQVKEAAAADVYYLQVESPAVIDDMDYWEDYERQRAIWAQRQKPGP